MGEADLINQEESLNVRPLRADVVATRARILAKHTPGIDQRRHSMLDELEPLEELTLRALVEALVLPVAEKLDDPDGGVAFIRLNAQLIGLLFHGLADYVHLAEQESGAEGGKSVRDDFEGSGHTATPPMEIP
jgi:hypothetical protein